MLEVLMWKRRTGSADRKEGRGGRAVRKGKRKEADARGDFEISGVTAGPAGPDRALVGRFAAKMRYAARPPAPTCFVSFLALPYTDRVG